MSLSSDIEVVDIDEIQFFDKGLVLICQQLADKGIRVNVAGLDMDNKRNPFGPIPNLCSIADHLEKVNTVCADCGNLANY